MDRFLSGHITSSGQSVSEEPPRRLVFDDWNCTYSKSPLATEHLTSNANSVLNENPIKIGPEESVEAVLIRSLSPFLRSKSPEAKGAGRRALRRVRQFVGVGY